jgi:peptidyl-dipeptidase Dcp
MSLRAAVGCWLALGSLHAMSASAAPAVGCAQLPAENPFACPSTLPYQLPPFDRIHDEDLAPAFHAGMAAELAEVAAIAGNPAPASFENTIVALERRGLLLERVNRTFNSLVASNSDEAILKLESELTPELASHSDQILLNAALFARIETLHRQRERLSLDPESRQLLERYYTDFVRAGARLSAGQKQQLRRYNRELAELTTRFRQNVLKAGSSAAVVVDDRAELDGLSEQDISSAALAADQRGLKGRWLIALQNTTTQPWLAQLRSRALRERIYRASTARARGGEHDNTAIVARIVRLRAERARLLGYDSHAAYVLEDEAAHDPGNAEKLLRQIGEAALRAARRDAAELQRIIDTQADTDHSARFQLEPWDWQYYAEQLRRQRYGFEAEQIKPYFELNRVLQDGVFYAAHELYGLSFQERHDLPVYQPDVRVFEVFDADGAPLALFLTDYYARDNKQGGSWMQSYVRQTKLLGLKPVVINNLNIPKPSAGAPALLTFDNVTTLFHEFGHALHGMFSNVQYPLLAGTQVPRDFVEYPSQFNEMWAREPAVLAHFARHYQSGEPMPQALQDKVIAAQTFDQGYLTLEYTEAALLDLAWHEITPQQAPVASAVMSFERTALASRAIAFAPVPVRYHSPYFLHIFSGGYSAGYYAYLWSEVLARDTGAWVHAHGGLTRANGDALRAGILSRGRSEDPRRLFEQFYGGPPQVGPLLQYRGLQ